LASASVIFMCWLVHSRKTVATPGIDRAAVILDVNSDERSASDWRYSSQHGFDAMPTFQDKKLSLSLFESPKIDGELTGVGELTGRRRLSYRL
jgi:hypothetical protein